jgi:hypothetical protein
MKYIKLILINCILLLSFVAFSQTECQDQIDQANKLFDEGLFREAEKITKSTLENCTLNKVQENEMLKLIASIYYEMDELELADEYVAKFVKKNPYYVSSKRNDPVQFRSAIKKVKSFPRFSAGFKAGVPLGLVNVKKIFPIFDTADYLQPYLTRPIFQGQLEFSWNIYSFISLNLGAGLRYQKIMNQVPLNNGLYYNYEEKNLSSNFPVSLGFTIPFGQSLAAKIYFGGEMEMFVQSKYDYFYTSETNIPHEFAVYLNQRRSNVVVNDNERRKIRYAGIGGIRLLYNLERFGIFADVKYIHEFDLYNNPQKRFSDKDLYLNNNYVLGDIMLENLDISLGMVYNFSYKVKSKY